ncbi:hypothetical protein L5515_008588 [Caenorhabditis briggsae]|uniref:Uncharacterized protein n=1 Tax=Caenorhabditis briggsae TaxID=6238 RepID=A0AAE9F7V4_CAEBR|nr:hypothetical protein L5515_008588 [Caenorhabditis briggsae]
MRTIIYLIFVLLTQYGVETKSFTTPSLNQILGMKDPCDAIKCYGLYECVMVDTPCFDQPPGFCPKQPSCTIVYV